MSAVFLSPRSVADAMKQKATAAFGTAGVSVSTAPGRVYRLSVVNKSATAAFVQIHDKASAPTAGNVPIWEGVLPASGGLVLDFGMSGLFFSLGLGLALSTTAGAFTVSAADNAVAYVQYAGSV